MNDDVIVAINRSNRCVSVSITALVSRYSFHRRSNKYLQLR